MSMPPPPPPGNYNPPPGYQPYGGGGYATAVGHPRATTVLVLGILSFFCFGIILGPIAIVLGSSALKEIDANPGGYTNRGTVKAGFVCGIVGTALSVVGILLLIRR